MSAQRPGPLQYVAYSYGKVLPASMHEWVIRDLGGPWAGARMATRLILPAFVGLGLLWLIPTSLFVHVGMTVPIFVPFMYFAIVLNPVYRRHRLQAHGLDPDLAEWHSRDKNYALRREYEERYGH
ncbi:MAG: DUF5313 domain-containing protein [Tomitella sp.]|nr:DUF5313 domain-containing protein [Tomitella sp.]